MTTHDLQFALAPLVERIASLEAMVTTLTDMTRELVAIRAAKAWYCTEEVASLIGKKPFTVRQWCNLKRLAATKREDGTWWVSHEELERFKSYGLLPPLHTTAPDRSGLR